MSGVRTRGFALATLAFVAILSCSVASAQVYRWTDASGNVHYTDTPPPTSARDYRTVSPPTPDAPRDPRTLPRHAPTVASQPSIPVATPPAARVGVQGDARQQAEQSRRYLQARQRDMARAEQALRDAEQCTDWYKALDRIEQANNEPRKRSASERKQLAQAKAGLKRDIAARCR